MAPLVALLFSAAGCRSGGDERPAVRAVVAANLRDAFEEMIGAFERAHPGVRVSATYTSSGAAAQQIVHGAPFDLFFSADVGYAESVAAAGSAEPGTLRVYARGGLALWVATRVGLEPSGLADAVDPQLQVRFCPAYSLIVFHPPAANLRVMASARPAT